MAQYTTAKICLNGHIISESIEISDNTDTYCSLCGALLTIKCPHCNAFIHGPSLGYGFTNPPYTAPSYCYGCGKPYPWTEAKLTYAGKIVDMLDELNEFQKVQLKESFPDLIIETPKTQLAALTASKIISKVSGVGRYLLTQWFEQNVIPAVFTLMDLKLK